MPKYDFLIVGAGLFGSVCAYELTQAGKRCLVIDQRHHIGGNCYSENQAGIEVHQYGAHIFHTHSAYLWQYIHQFGEFLPFINAPIAIVAGEAYNLPFNMNLFSRIFGLTHPAAVKAKIDQERAEYQSIQPRNLEEQAIKLVGKTIYRLLIQGYTQKQWGRPCTDLPPQYITRLPLRFTYDNNYFNDTYQGIPKDGYTSLFNRMLQGIPVELGLAFTPSLATQAQQIIYTGMIDQLFDYRYGSLAYRSLQFIHQLYPTQNYQGNAVMNYPSLDIPYTRSIEHRHFNQYTQAQHTLVSYEFSLAYQPQTNLIPYYPLLDADNLNRYRQYLALSLELPHVHVGGRLGSYQYFDMDDTIASALKLVKSILGGSPDGQSANQ